MKDKQQLRQEFIKKRQALAGDEIIKKSKLLVSQVIAAIDWQPVQSLHCFLPLVADNEPDMRGVIEYALQKGAAVYTSNPPIATGRQVMMLEDDSLQTHIKDYALGDRQQFDVVIVPMLAFDPQTKQRLGFGGGFYDRFLAMQPHAVKLGVCFGECIAPLPQEPHDVPLDECFIA